MLNGHHRLQLVLEYIEASQDLEVIVLQVDELSLQCFLIRLSRVFEFLLEVLQVDRSTHLVTRRYSELVYQTGEEFSLTLKRPRQSVSL